jgi:hypothetical protein
MRDDDFTGAYLVGDELGPEAGGGAVVGVGGEDPRRRPAVERLVDVLDDDEGLADGAAAVEEDGDGAVDGVVREQQLALAGQVLHDQLVRHPLERERHLHAVRERAAERRDELHRRRRRLCCWLLLRRRHPDRLDFLPRSLAVGFFCLGLARAELMSERASCCWCI